MEFLTAKNNSSYTILFLTACAILSAFMPLLAGSEQEGIFGFAWMSSFLNALIVPTISLCVSLILLVIKQNSVKEMRFSIGFISFLFLGLSIYYYAYVFWPITNSDFPVQVYYLVLLLFTIALLLLSVPLVRGINKIENKLKTKVRLLMSFIYTEVDNKEYIKDHLRDEYAIDRINLVDKVVEDDL